MPRHNPRSASRAGTRFVFDAGLSGYGGRRGDGACSVEFQGMRILMRCSTAWARAASALHPAGRCPTDRSAYQTVYAAVRGAVAAPTAGLHFTPSFWTGCGPWGLRWRPSPCTSATEHLRRCGRRTSARTGCTPSAFQSRRKRLPPSMPPAPTASGWWPSHHGGAHPGVRDRPAGTDGGRQRGLRPFIHPGFRFKAVDAMITNFHLPKSTLLMLVSAFAGRENVLNAYREAVRRALPVLQLWGRDAD